MLREAQKEHSFLDFFRCQKTYSHNILNKKQKQQQQLQRKKDTLTH